MQKIQIVGLKGQRRPAIRFMQKLGVVQLERVDEKDKDIYDFADAGWRIEQVDKEISKNNEALEILAKFAKRKPILDEIDSNDFLKEDTYVGLRDIIETAIGRWNELENSKEELKKNTNKLEKVAPWEALAEFDVKNIATQECSIAFGTMPTNTKIDSELVAVEVVNSDKAYDYVCVAGHNSCEDYLQILHDAGFAEEDFDGYSSFEAMNLTYKKAIEDAESVIEKAKEELKHFAERDYADLLVFSDYLTNLRERRAAVGFALASEKTFIMNGWVAQDSYELVKKGIEKETGVFIRKLALGKDEEAPTLVKNSKVVQPFELVTELYSIPSSKEADPNFIMAIFYFIFFGIMLADAGYGILLMIISPLIIWIKKPKGVTRQMLMLVGICGVSTFIWGALFGGWFGNITQLVGNYPLNPLWIDPMASCMTFLIMSFAFGLLHIVAGIAMKAYMLIKSKKYADAIYDQITWIILLLGVAVLAAGLKKSGLIMIIVGAASLVMTQGRNEKNIFMKIFKGVGSLYGIMTYFSDVLSYSRLLAIGLAGGVISMVFNTVGTLLGTNSVVGIAFLIIIMLIGHTFNLLISILGAYVHASRLQYVEFFGKFFTGGGRKFSPIRYKTKHIEVK